MPGQIFLDIIMSTINVFENFWFSAKIANTGSKSVGS